VVRRFPILAGISLPEQRTVPIGLKEGVTP